MAYFANFEEGIKAFDERPNDFSLGNYLTEFNVANVNMPCYICDQEIKKVADYYKITLSRYGYIITKIEINGFNISQIQILIGGQIMWEYIIDQDFVKQVILEPFISGIIIVCLSYHEVQIIVKAGTLFSVNAHYIMKLPRKECQQLMHLMQDGIRIKYESPFEIMYNETCRSEFIYCCGMGIQQFIKLTSEAEIEVARERRRETILKQKRNTFTAFVNRKYAIIAMDEHMFCDCCWDK